MVPEILRMVAAAEPVSLNTVIINTHTPTDPLKVDRYFLVVTRKSDAKSQQRKRTTEKHAL